MYLIVLFRIATNISFSSSFRKYISRSSINISSLSSHRSAICCYFIKYVPFLSCTSDFHEYHIHVQLPCHTPQNFSENLSTLHSIIHNLAFCLLSSSESKASFDLLFVIYIGGNFNLKKLRPANKTPNQSNFTLSNIPIFINFHEHKSCPKL